MVRRWSSATSEYEAEASGSSASEQVKSRLLKAVVFNFNQLDLDPPTAAVPNRLFLRGGAPPMSFGAYQIDSSM